MKLKDYLMEGKYSNEKKYPLEQLYRMANSLAISHEKSAMKDLRLVNNEIARRKKKKADK